jgi:hypothetical protein
MQGLTPRVPYNLPRVRSIVTRLNKNGRISITCVHRLIVGGKAFKLRLFVSSTCTSSQNCLSSCILKILDTPYHTICILVYYTVLLLVYVSFLFTLFCLFLCLSGNFNFWWHFEEYLI